MATERKEPTVECDQCRQRVHVMNMRLKVLGPTWTRILCRPCEIMLAERFLNHVMNGDGIIRENGK